MKRQNGFKMFVGLIVLMVMGIALVGCTSNASIVGKWASTQSDQVIEFKEDGTYIGLKQTNYKYELGPNQQLKITNPEYKDGTDSIEMTYTLKGDVLTTTYKGDSVEWHRK